MKQINRLTALLTEIVSKNYKTTCEEGNILIRIMNNINRYELVYYLIITVMQLVFLLISKDLLLPAFIMMIMPISTLILNPYMTKMMFLWSLYPLIVTFAFIVSIINNTHLLFSLDVILSFGMILTHAMTFDCTPFENLC